MERRPIPRDTLIFVGSLCIGLFGCSAPFPSGNISAAIAGKTGTYLTDASASYSVYAGYGSDCAHPGVHANFTPGTYNVYAVLAGVVARVSTCSGKGSQNDKYDISLAVGMKGNVPVYVEYSLEPTGGILCSAGNPNYFKKNILVSPGDKVTQGQKIALFEAIGNAHIHFNLKVDGATMCPDIFPSTVFSAQTGPLLGCSGAPSDTFCYNLTRSEDPERLK